MNEAPRSRAQIMEIDPRTWSPAASWIPVKDAQQTTAAPLAQGVSLFRHPNVPVAATPTECLMASSHAAHDGTTGRATTSLW